MPRCHRDPAPKETFTRSQQVAISAILIDFIASMRLNEYLRLQGFWPVRRFGSLCRREPSRCHRDPAPKETFTRSQLAAISSIHLIVDSSMLAAGLMNSLTLQASTTFRRLQKAMNGRAQISTPCKPRTPWWGSSWENSCKVCFLFFIRFDVSLDFGVVESCWSLVALPSECA